jgi:hypothetical protein
MSNAQHQLKAPTRRVYAVSKYGPKNNEKFSQEIGAAWEHEDGDGFSKSGGAFFRKFTHFQFHY